MKNYWPLVRTWTFTSEPTPSHLENILEKNIFWNNHRMFQQARCIANHRIWLFGWVNLWLLNFPYSLPIPPPSLWFFPLKACENFESSSRLLYPVLRCMSFDPRALCASMLLLLWLWEDQRLWDDPGNQRWCWLGSWGQQSAWTSGSHLGGTV